jgi:hypothetical protein
MIGSCAPLYLPQQYPYGDMRMRRTLETLADRYFLDGPLFQEFILSGKNPDPALQIAQAWLYAVERQRLCVHAFIRWKVIVSHCGMLNMPSGGNRSSNQ